MQMIRADSGPMQPQQARGETLNVGRRSPQKSTRTKDAGNLGNHVLRIADVFQQLAGNDDIKVATGVTSLRKLSAKHLQAFFTNVLDRCPRDLHSLGTPAVARCGLQHRSRSKSYLKQPV